MSDCHTKTAAGAQSDICRAGTRFHLLPRAHDGHFLAVDDQTAAPHPHMIPRQARHALDEER